MANIALETESTLTERFQATVPSFVRRALHLNKKDKIRYVIQADGNVLMTKKIKELMVVKKTPTKFFLKCLSHDTRQMTGMIF